MTIKTKRRYTPKLRNKYNKSKTRNNHNNRRYVNKTSSFFGGAARLELNETQVNKFQQVTALIRFATNSMINSKDETASVNTILNKETLAEISEDPNNFIKKLDAKEAQEREQKQVQSNEQVEESNEQVQSDAQVEEQEQESDSDDETYDPDNDPNVVSKSISNLQVSPEISNSNKSNNMNVVNKSPVSPVSNGLGLSITGTSVNPGNSNRFGNKLNNEIVNKNKY